MLLNRTISLQPGETRRTWREVLPSPSQRSDHVLTVSSLNEHAQYFEDSVAVAFHEGFEHGLKWATMLPFALTVAAVLYASQLSAAPLPI